MSARKTPMTDQSKSISRRWLYIPFAVAGAVFFAYFLLWRIGAGEMEKAVGQWITDQRAMGVEITHEAITRDGFPFFLRVHIDQPMIATPEVGRWRGERLSIDALPYDLTRVIFSPNGAQEIYVAGYGDWRVNADDIKASIASDKERGWVFSVTVDDAKAQSLSDDGAAAIDSLIFDLAPVAAEPTTLALTLAGAGLKIDAADTVFHLSDLNTVLILTRTDLLSGPDPVSQWRDAGGALIVAGLIAEIEDTKFSISGEIGLDAADYPSGRLDAEIANPAGLAQWLGAAGALSEEEAASTGAGLTLLAIASGGKISAPIDFSNGAAEIAGVKLANLPAAQ